MSICNLFDEIFIGYLLYEAIYFACGLVFEDQYTNNFLIDNDKISKSYNNILEDRIILMSNTQLIKSFLVILGLVKYGIVLYFLYSNLDELLINLNLKKFFHIIIIFL